MFGEGEGLLLEQGERGGGWAVYMNEYGTFQAGPTVYYKLKILNEWSLTEGGLQEDLMHRIS